MKSLFLSLVIASSLVSCSKDAPNQTVPEFVTVKLTPQVLKDNKPGSLDGVYKTIVKQSTGFKGNGYVVVQWDDMLGGVKQTTIKDTVKIPDPGNVEVFHYTNYIVGSGNVAANVKIISHSFDNSKVTFEY
jgi:hypothetical protein